MNTQEIDQYFLLRALDLAKIQRGLCAPNPSVGAVIVKDEQILAQGYHEGPGSPHAEVLAIQNLTSSVKDATLYVSLEPCCHWGRTPPCTDAILKAGFKKVVYGLSDPNPLVAGKGAALLKKAGLACYLLELPDIREFYASYIYWQTTRRPRVTAKIAMSLDGKIAGKNGERIQFTGMQLQEFTHTQRKLADGILTTSKTILADDPQLNARCKDKTFAKNIYILDTQLRLPSGATLFRTAKSLTVFHGAQASKERQNELNKLGVRCIQVQQDSLGLNLHEVLQKIGEFGIHDLWVEAGGQCFSALLKARLLQRAFIYIAPRWLGQGQPAFADENCLNSESGQWRWQSMGQDVLGEVNW